MGSAAQDDALYGRFARRLGILVAAVEYRLAPKHPYPAALQDCYQAYKWLGEQPEIGSGRIIVGGASAGGGLAAALAILARDCGAVRPLFQLLAYPMVDDRSSNTRSDKDRYFRLWSRNSNRLGWQAYLRGADPQRAVPARRADLSGLPPAWVGVGTLDPLYDEGSRTHAGS